jgi:Fe-Mn family superoxide dismutase
MQDLTRRDVLGAAALAGGWLTLGSSAALAQEPPRPTPSEPAKPPEGPWSLPALPYDYAALEPHIGAQIVKLHHDIHHAGYVKAANEAVAKLESIRRTGGDAIRDVRAVTDALAFNLAGHRLHMLYWTNMKPGGGGDPPEAGEIAKLIKRDFGTNEAFFAQFSAAGAQVQGSGWSILAWEPVSQRLLVLQAEKHQNLHAPGVVPLLAMDVWEHAYYLQYQNQRTSYIKAFLNVINWPDVEQRLAAARKVEVA